MSLEERLARWLAAVQYPDVGMITPQPVYIEWEKEFPQVAYVSDGDTAPTGARSMADGLEIHFAFDDQVGTRDHYRIFRVIIAHEAYDGCVNATTAILDAAKREFGIMGSTAPYDLAVETPKPVYQRVLFLIVRPRADKWSVLP